MSALVRDVISVQARYNSGFKALQTSSARLLFIFVFEFVFVFIFIFIFIFIFPYDEVGVASMMESVALVVRMFVVMVCERIRARRKQRKEQLSS